MKFSASRSNSHQNLNFFLHFLLFFALLKNLVFHPKPPFLRPHHLCSPHLHGKLIKSTNCTQTINKPYTNGLVCKCVPGLRFATGLGSGLSLFDVHSYMQMFIHLADFQRVCVQQVDLLFIFLPIFITLLLGCSRSGHLFGMFF